MATIKVIVFPAPYVKEIEVDAEGSALRGLQALVDGSIELSRITPRLDCWFNEEGLLRADMPLNPAAETLLHHSLCGTFVFAGTDGKGATISVPDDMFERFFLRNKPEPTMGFVGATEGAFSFRPEP